MTEPDPIAAPQFAAIERTLGESPAGMPLAALVAVMRDALASAADVRRARWRDVEPDPHGGAALRLHAPDGHWRPARSQVRYLSARTMRLLAPLRRAPDEPLFAGRGGAPLGGDAVSSRIRKAAAAAGLRGRYSAPSPALGMQLDLGAWRDGGIEYDVAAAVRGWHALGAARRPWLFPGAGKGGSAPPPALNGLFAATGDEATKFDSVRAVRNGAWLRAMLTHAPGREPEETRWAADAWRARRGLSIAAPFGGGPSGGPGRYEREGRLAEAIGCRVPALRAACARAFAALMPLGFPFGRGELGSDAAAARLARELGLNRLETAGLRTVLHEYGFAAYSSKARDPRTC